MNKDKSILQKIAELFKFKNEEKKDFLKQHNLEMREELIKKYMKRAGK